MFFADLLTLYHIYIMNQFPASDFVSITINTIQCAPGISNLNHKASEAETNFSSFLNVKQV